LGLSRMMTPTSMNILDLILADHNRFRALYDAYMLPHIQPEQKQLLAWEMIMVRGQAGRYLAPSRPLFVCRSQVLKGFIMSHRVRRLQSLLQTACITKRDMSFGGCCFKPTHFTVQ
jgi:hypothetical protein